MGPAPAGRGALEAAFAEFVEFVAFEGGARGTNPSMRNASPALPGVGNADAFGGCVGASRSVITSPLALAAAVAVGSAAAPEPEGSGDCLTVEDPTAAEDLAVADDEAAKAVAVAEAVAVDAAFAGGHQRRTEF